MRPAPDAGQRASTKLTFRLWAWAMAVAPGAKGRGGLYEGSPRAQACPAAVPDPFGTRQGTAWRAPPASRRTLLPVATPRLRHGSRPAAKRGRVRHGRVMDRDGRFEQRLLRLNAILLVLVAALALWT